MVSVSTKNMVEYVQSINKYLLIKNATSLGHNHQRLKELRVQEHDMK